MEITVKKRISLKYFNLRAKTILFSISQKTEKDEIPFEVLESEIPQAGQKYLEFAERISTKTFNAVKRAISSFSLNFNDSIYNYIDEHFYNFELFISEQLKNLEFEETLEEMPSNIFEPEYNSLSLEEKKCFSLSMLEEKQKKPIDRVNEKLKNICEGKKRTSNSQNRGKTPDKRNLKTSSSDKNFKV